MAKSLQTYLEMLAENSHREFDGRDSLSFNFRVFREIAADLPVRFNDYHNFNPFIVLPRALLMFEQLAIDLWPMIHKMQQGDSFQCCNLEIDGVFSSLAMIDTGYQIDTHVHFFDVNCKSPELVTFQLALTFLHRMLPKPLQSHPGQHLHVYSGITVDRDWAVRIKPREPGKYLFDGIQPYPFLMGDNFITECGLIGNGNLPMGIKSQWLRRVAMPLLSAGRQMENNIDYALQLAADIVSDDWRVCALAYLQHRKDLKQHG